MTAEILNVGPAPAVCLQASRSAAPRCARTPEWNESLSFMGARSPIARSLRPLHRPASRGPAHARRAESLFEPQVTPSRFRRRSIRAHARRLERPCPREDAGYYRSVRTPPIRTTRSFTRRLRKMSPLKRLESELRRVPLSERGSWRALEIGCGPAACLMRPMSRHFAEIDAELTYRIEMIGIARQPFERSSQCPILITTTGTASLSLFPDETFDFVYSYAVFQHIPRREVVLQYLRETHRVMKGGGLARLQFNRTSQGRSETYNTWSGARFSSSEVMEFRPQQRLSGARTRRRRHAVHVDLVGVNATARVERRAGNLRRPTLKAGQS